MQSKEMCDKIHEHLSNDVSEIKLDVKEIKAILNDLKVDNALLNFKSSMWGGLSGAFIYGAIYLIEKIKP